MRLSRSHAAIALLGAWALVAWAQLTAYSAAAATLSDVVEKYNHELPTSACQADKTTRTAPMNVVFTDNAYPTDSRSGNHVQYHTFQESGAFVTEWTTTNADAEGWYNSTDCVGPVRQLARPYNNVSQRFHLRIYKYPYTNVGLGAVDVGQAHHEVDCGTLGVEDHLLRDYYGLDEARDLLATDLGSDGTGTSDHKPQPLADWQNTYMFDARKGDCSSGYTTESDGYVYHIPIPDSGHNGWNSG